MTNSRTFTVLDLFSGCGGLSLGLHWAEGPKKEKFKTVAAVDVWEAACRTYEENLEIKPYIEPVSNRLISQIIEKVGPIDLIVGGPPCQGFSTSGKRSLDDPRNKLVFDYLEAIRLAKPKAFLMENVSGFTTFQDGKLLSEVKKAASDLGYKVQTAIVQASLAGVPQRRRRFIMVGTLANSTFSFPGSEASNKKPDGDLDYDLTFRDGEEKWTIWDAISDLPSLSAGKASFDYKTAPQNSLQEFLRAGNELLTLHKAVNHSANFVKMMSYIPQGKSALDPEILKTIPDDIRPGSGYPNSYARLKQDQPAPTITRNFTTPSSANCIHPSDDRALTPREGARCQTFPDNFVFLGTPEEVRLQIGNAVPPLLAKKLGDELLRILSE